MKGVIFIGGSSYSGSTLFDMMISNDEKVFSCGEVHALFHPFRKHHINPVCGCGDRECKIWPKVLRRGEGRIYEEIVEMLPEVEWIVDSSKSPLWIEDQTKGLLKRNIHVENLLIWKTPEEFALSCYKRKKLKGWEKHWINYYQRYFSFVKEWVSIPYRTIAERPSYVLENLASRLKMDYAEGKERFWEKKHHTLFGNNSAKIHLYSQDSEKFAELGTRLPGVQTERGGPAKKSAHYRTIYYESGLTTEGQKTIWSDEKKEAAGTEIIEILEGTGVENDGERLNWQNVRRRFAGRPFPFWRWNDRVRRLYHSSRIRAEVLRSR
jgi:hypothetical protein